MQNIQQDGMNQIEEITDFGNVFLNTSQAQEQNQILNRPIHDNNFNNFLNVPPFQNPLRTEEYQKNYFINNYQEHEGSTKIRLIPQDQSISNQTSGRIPQDVNYEQDYYSNQNTDNYSRYNCQLADSMSQEFYSGDIQYKYSGQIQNLEVEELKPINKTNLQITMKFDERYYNQEECPHLVPVEQISYQLNKIDMKGQHIQQFAEDQSDSQEPSEFGVDPEIINQQSETTKENQIKIKKTKRGKRKNKNKSANQQQEDKNQQQQDQDQIDQQQQEIVSDLNSQSENAQFEELDDAVSEEFKKNITDFMENIEKQKFSLTQTIYGTQTQQKSIRIIEIQNYESQIKLLCKQFPHIKYSEIALSLQLIVNYENCQQFLQSLQFQENKPILREINQLLVHEQKAKDSGDNNELFMTQYQINEFKKTNKKIIIHETQSLYETAIKIIELNNYKFDIKKCDQKTKEQKKLDLEQNRVQVIEINNRKQNIIKQYQTCVINEQQFNQYLKQIRIEKQKLEKVGKNLFLDLMAIDNGFCRIDFHKFYASEIENILDGVFDKVESYKICNKVDSIKLQIIVGKGLHSKNKKPIIGPMTQQYIQQYLQQIVEIKEGKIDVIV